MATGTRHQAHAQYVYEIHNLTLLPCYGDLNSSERNSERTSETCDKTFNKIFDTRSLTLILSEVV